MAIGVYADEDHFGFIDLKQNELRQARAQNLGSAPSSPVRGQFYYDTPTETLLWWDNTAWQSAKGGVSGIPPTLIDAKGDLITGTADNTPARKAVGANGAALFASSAQADGLQWRGIVAADLSDFLTTVQGVRLSAMTAPNLPVSFAGQELTNLAAPTAPNSAATKAYVDAAAQGLDVKASVRAASTANVSLSGLQTLDGVTLVSGDRVLLKDQTSGQDNGIYVASATAWARATDADVSAEVTPGMFAFVEEGTLYADTGWVLTTNAPIVLATTPLVFAQFSGAGTTVAGLGLTRTGTTLAINTAVVVRKYAAAIGDGAALAYTVTHNLGTQDVTVSVYAATGVFDEVGVTVEHTTVNTCTVRFTVAPASNAYRVVVHG